MKTAYVLAIGAAAMFAAPAMAQDSAFSGPYLGVIGGFDSVRASVDGEGGSESDFAYGAVAGYDYDLGSAVIGLEAEIAGSNVSVQGEDVFAFDDSLTIKAGRDFYAGARIGAKLAPNVLLYGKAGYTNAKIKGIYDDGIDVVKDSSNMSGFRLGAGLEYSFGRFSLRGEYRYSDYGDFKVDGFNTGLSFQRHQVVAAVVGKF